MSQLQISLLIIGVVVVLVMYVYSWWQQRKYRRRYGAAFEHVRKDALYLTPAEKMVVKEWAADQLPEMPEEPIITVKARPTPPLPVETLPTQPVTVETKRIKPLTIEPPRLPATDGVCALLDAATDFIAVLTFDVPAGADSLALLWQKRFDFGKSINVCGLNETTGKWEKVIAEGHLFYAAFKLSLQLSDRSGPVSDVQLGDFRDLVRDIAAHLDARADMPNVAATCARAVELDNYCASVDKMIGLNILPAGDRTFLGSEITRVAELHGMALQADGTFHRSDAQGNTIFTLGNYENIPFQHHTLANLSVKGLNLSLDVPRVEQPTKRFDEMSVLARQLAMDLRAAVVDDNRVALGEPGFAQIRDQIAAIDRRMQSGRIPPGSPQARRLFS